eukprot:432484-Rhodomonas_salina.5
MPLIMTHPTVSVPGLQSKSTELRRRSLGVDSFHFRAPYASSSPADPPDGDVDTFKCIPFVRLDISAAFVCRYRDSVITHQCVQPQKSIISST